MARFLVVAAANVLFLGGVYFGTTAEQKVELRFAMFSRSLGAAAFSLPPDKLSEIGFRSYSTTFRQAFVNRYADRINRLVLPDVKGKRSVEAVKKLVLAFSRNGVEGGCGEKSPDLIQNIDWVMNGHGCCSDHAQVFIALALLHEIPAREVSNRMHTFNEYWDERLGKWVWVDPQFALMATDARGRHLGLWEIQQRLKARQEVRWDFFGTSVHLFAREPVTSHPIFQPAAFGSIHLVLGNRVFRVNEWNRRLAFLPKAVRQMVLYSIEIEPHYGYLEDPVDGGRSFTDMIRPYRVGLALYGLANLLGILWCLVGWRERRVRLKASRKLVEEPALDGTDVHNALQVPPGIA